MCGVSSLCAAIVPCPSATVLRSVETVVRLSSHGNQYITLYVHSLGVLVILEICGVSSRCAAIVPCPFAIVLRSVETGVRLSSHGNQYITLYVHSLGVLMILEICGVSSRCSAIVPRPAVIIRPQKLV